MAQTALQQLIGDITIPPTPKTGSNPAEIQQATATWTKQCQQALLKISKVLGGLDTSLIPNGPSTRVINNVPTTTGIYFTPTAGRALFSATAPLVYDITTGNFSIPAADTITDGFLSATDWNTFNGKLSSGRRIDTASPLSGGGDLSADRIISIPPSKADNLTLGAAAFASTDFNDDGAGTISLDYVNGQKASVSVNGFLSSTDWSTFNSKLSSSRTISTTAPLTGGGDLSANRTFAITQSSASVDGYLSSTDWSIFNSKVGTSRSISTTAPLTGGGDFSANRTFAITKADSTHDGYLASADFVAFLAAALPTGGTTGQVLKKNSSTNYDASFANVIGSAVVGTTTGAISLDLTSPQFQTVTLTGNPTFSTTNRANGTFLSLKIDPNGSSRTLAFSASWRWLAVNYSAGLTLASGKFAVLSLTCYGTNETDILAVLAVEP